MSGAPHRILAAAVLGACAALAAVLPVAAAEPPTLPDWSGSWRRVHPDFPYTYLKLHPQSLTPAAAAKLEAVRVGLRTPGVDLSAPGIYCQPFHFVGDNGGLIDTFEFLFSPGRVTLINELGLVRRIFTDGRPLPPREKVIDSNSGTSIGHWEGSTLVVETVGLNPLARYPVEQFDGAPRIGANAHVLERISLKSPDLMQIDTELTAPEIMTAPYRTSFTYQRDLKHTPVDDNSCSSNDRTIDPKTGKQHLDLTPPADLPPPPTS